MTRRITIFDTTLRDGEQSPGISLRRHSLVAVTVALVFVEFFVNPRNDRDFLCLTAIKLRHDPVGDSRKCACLLVSEESNRRNFFQTLADDFTRLVVPVRRRPFVENVVAGIARLKGFLHSLTLI